MKLRFKYGKLFSFGLVNKVSKNKAINLKGVNPNQKQINESLKVRIIHGLAKIKDIIIFGIPALFIWLYFLPLQKRYIGLFVIARKKG